MSKYLKYFFQLIKYIVIAIIWELQVILYCFQHISHSYQCLGTGQYIYLFQKVRVYQKLERKRNYPCEGKFSIRLINLKNKIGVLLPDLFFLSFFLLQGRLGASNFTQFGNNIMDPKCKSCILAFEISFFWLQAFLAYFMYF